MTARCSRTPGRVSGQGRRRCSVTGTGGGLAGCGALDLDYMNGKHAPLESFAGLAEGDEVLVSVRPGDVRLAAAHPGAPVGGGLAGTPNRA